MRQLDDGDVITVSSDIRLRFSAGQNPPYTFRKRYSRLDLLGKGHFARVRRCRSGGRDFAARFLRTRQDTPLDEKANLILLGIQHPNIVAIREVFHEGDRMIYVMELMGGNSLFNLLTSKQMLAETEGRTIFRQVFSAIQFLVGWTMTPSAYPIAKDRSIHAISCIETSNPKVSSWLVRPVFRQNLAASTLPRICLLAVTSRRYAETRDS